MRNPHGPTQKQCRKCGFVLPIESFRPKTATCKPCDLKRQAAWVSRNRAAVNLIKSRHRKAHSESHREDYASDSLKQTRNIYRAMIQRCYDVNAQNYKRYGARGITVCDRWKDSFKNFLVDVGLRPSSDFSIDRFPDNNGNYEPGNVRWATGKQQRANRRDSRKAA
jgi:hypothetical protein